MAPCNAMRCAADPSSMQPQPLDKLPLRLAVVIALYGLGIAVEVVALATDAAPASVVRLVLSSVILVLLVRGNEGARTFVRFSSALSVAIGVLMLFGAASLGSTNAASTFLMLGVFTIAVSGFTFWALGTEEVQAWMVPRLPNDVPE